MDEEKQDTIQAYCQSTIYVISNIFVRNALKLIFLIQEQPVPFKIVSTLEQAEFIARKLIGQEAA